jgi:soluble lytic murein transglycosylase-like protein
MIAPLKHLRYFVLAVSLGSLLGCSQNGFMPGGPHALGAARLNSLVTMAAQAYGVRPSVVSAVIDAESHGDPAAVSRAGAQGLMQLMPATSEQYGVFNAFDPVANVNAGTHYLADLLRRYHGDLKLALAAYNAGPGAVAAAHGIPNFGETQAYVARVTASLR